MCPPNCKACEEFEKDFSGYDENGKPMYRDTVDGPQCQVCGLLNGDHDEECPNR